MVKFYGIPIIWIRLAHDRSPEDSKTRGALAEFLRTNHIFPVVPGTGGPTEKTEGYKPEDARKVIQWLKDHGAEVDPSILLS